ncbi:MAG: hypothetical protein ACYC3L_02265 [Gemmatimonadaceae bacterium]
MKFRNSLLAAGVALVAASGAAQAQCSTTTADACRKSQDIFNFLTPQISTALVGGSTTLGQGGVLGGFPHFALALRASAVNGTLPTVGEVNFSTTGEKASAYPGKDKYVPMASIDGSLGLFKGFPMGVTRVGGLDLLMTATYVPNVSSGSDEVQVDLPGGSTKLGYGVRVGLLQESIVVPGVSFSYVKRDLPTLTVTGTSTPNPGGGAFGAGGSFALNDLTLKTSSWRVSASKTFMIFGLEGGFGQDKYDNSANAHVTVNAAAPVGTQTASIDVANTMTRTNIYGGLIINFFIGKLVGEVGRVSGGSLPAAMNTFGSDAAASRTYFSVGLRTGF